ncbi:uncharacterized protein KY384_002833 [Bacidia gigantensis]|uniref:uncharacterized protein n=1 Tax=Bacidia gigantensis TaxID=2732470 RepID=UPI001D04A80D|nr:uncharacterized protein KY384_002833 [Bacidia gigantensis]KAG8532348.1 hypothetical protein KY384_002833 [Bacidia gigantensis]
MASLSKRLDGLSGQSGKSGIERMQTSNRNNNGKSAERKSGLSSAPLAIGGGGALKALNQSPQITPLNGSMSFSIPVPTSASRSAAATPSLALSYSSGQGNGPFGLGWNVQVSEISRKTANTIPRYAESDTFVLSGYDDLVPTESKYEQPPASSDWTVRRFRPRIDPQNLRIEQWSNKTKKSDVYWRTITGDNTTTVYGDSAFSRVASKAMDGDLTPPKTFSWLCSKVYDATGNCMEFTYKPEDGAGLEDPNNKMSKAQRDRASAYGSKLYLKSIKYGNRAVNRDLKTWKVSTEPMQYLFQVILDYGEHDQDNPKTTDSKPWSLRGDCFSRFNSGFELRTQRLCRRLLNFHLMPESDTLGRAESLVSSVSLGYQESKHATKLMSVRIEGHTVTDGGHERLAMPPYQFTYQETPLTKTLETMTVNVAKINNLPGERPSEKVDWVDFDGEGSPGLLSMSNSYGWQYQRNENALSGDARGGSFSRPQVINPRPNTGTDWVLQDLDGTGKLDLTSLQEPGYYERGASNDWGHFQNYPSWPVVNTADDFAFRMDVTGDSLLDIVHLDVTNSQVIWLPSLGKKGFGPPQRATGAFGIALLGEKDTSNMITTADMTGDGLSDIVSISNGLISYWPNLGYGRFGDEIVMMNSPVFDLADRFTTERMRLADVDGSGTCDIIYFPQRGGAIWYANQSGNDWAGGQAIANFPFLQSLDSVSVVDLLGNGTSCLVWCGSGQTTGRPTFHFVDLTKGLKPHLLSTITNGFGLKTTVQYKPSTSYYLNDNLKGNKWKRSLPFPIQCVERITIIDEITSTSRQTRYEYHDGYYDMSEREFCGFGAVETWIRDSFPAISSRKAFSTPEKHSKTWFYTNSDSPQALLGTAFKRQHQASCHIPKDLDGNDAPSASRALNGSILREEIYGHDTTQQTPIPLTVHEFGYTSRKLQSGDKSPAVFASAPRETVNFYYEGQSDIPPRIEHSISPLYNEYGDPILSVTIAYGRIPTATDTSQVALSQQASIVRCQEIHYTNSVDDLDNLRTPLVCSSRSYHLSDSPKDFVAAEQIVSDLVVHRKAVKLTNLGKASDHPASSTLIAESRVFFKDNELKTVPTIGRLEAFSIVDRSYDLALDQNSLKTIVPSEDTEFDRKLRLEVLPKSGYINLDSDDRWWVMSSTISYSTSSGQADELALARASFYRPIRTLDAMNSVSTTKWDTYWLLPTEITDAVKNSSKTLYDYNRLLPRQIENANGNRRQTIYDCLGEPIAFAVLGKSSEQVGDSLVGYSRPITDILGLLQAGNLDGLRAFIRDAGSITVVDRKRFAQTSQATSGNVTPAFKVDISRDKHFRNGEAQLSVAVTYLDGSGAPYQATSISRTFSGGVSWHNVIFPICDLSGVPTMDFAPFFGNSCAFIPPTKIAGAITHYLTDTLQRQIGIFHPDHTWSLTRSLPWEVQTRSESRTLKIDPKQDATVGPYIRLLPEQSYSPSWFEEKMKNENTKVAAQRSSDYGDKPITTYSDAIGRPIATSQKLGSQELVSTVKYDRAGNLRSKSDARQRLAEVNEYDYNGQCVLTKSMDSGEKCQLVNFRGQPIFAWTNRKTRFRYEYDEIGRLTKVFQRNLGPEILAVKNLYGEGETNASARNLWGQLVTSLDQAGVQKYLEFDFKSNCTQISFEVASDYRNTLDWSVQNELLPEVYKNAIEYDAHDRVRSETDSQDNTSYREYNRMSQEISAGWKSPNSQPKDYISQIVYTQFGDTSTFKYGNGCIADFSHDRVTGNLMQRKFASGAVVLQDTGFQYDCEGRKVQVENKAAELQYLTGKVVKPISEYTYDPLGRLIRATGREWVDTQAKATRSPSTQPKVLKAPVEGSQLRNYQEIYDYDDADNLALLNHEIQNDPAIPGWQKKQIYEEKSILDAATPSNRLSRIEIAGLTETYTYEGISGEQGCVTKVGPTTLTWDVNGLLRSTTQQAIRDSIPETTWYVYNSSGNRIRKTTARPSTDPSKPQVMRDTLFLGNLEIQRSFTPSPSPSSPLQLEREKHKHTLSAAGAVVLLETSKTPASSPPLARYQFPGGLETDDTGKILSYEEYSPFGISTFLATTTTTAETDIPSNHRFASYDRDAETGLSHCGLRYYSPSLSRFLSPDPLGSIDSTNLYLYCGADPINFRDPSGTVGEEVETLAPQPVKPGSSIGTFFSKLFKRGNAVKPDKAAKVPVPYDGRDPDVQMHYTTGWGGIKEVNYRKRPPPSLPYDHSAHQASLTAFDTTPPTAPGVLYGPQTQSPTYKTLKRGNAIRDAKLPETAPPTYSGRDPDVQMHYTIGWGGIKEVNYRKRPPPVQEYDHAKHQASLMALPTTAPSYPEMGTVGKVGREELRRGGAIFETGVGVGGSKSAGVKGGGMGTGMGMGGTGMGGVGGVASTGIKVAKFSAGFGGGGGGRGGAPSLSTTSPGAAFY